MLAAVHRRLRQEDLTAFALAVDDVVRSLRAASAQQEVTPSSAVALAILDAGGPMRLTQLAAATGITQPAMSQLVARMEGDDLVARELPPDDRRAVLVSLTAHGESIVHERRRLRAATLGKALDALDDAELAAVVAAIPALQRLASVMRTDDGPDS